MNVYFISGLGADERAFGKLKLPGEWNCIYLGWPEFSENDTVETYARKYIPLIDTKNKFILIGLSFGGMIATELAKILKPEKTILISSICTHSQMSGLMKFSRVTRIHRIFPAGLIKIIPDSLKIKFAKSCVGTPSEEEQSLMKDFINKSSPRFMKWAAHAIVNWKNEIKPEGVYQINGSADLIFSLKNVKADVMIKDGGHFMVFNKSDQVSEAIIQSIKS